MNHSAKSDDWLATIISKNPIRLAPDGDIITCPVRLRYANIFEPGSGMPGDQDSDKVLKYGACVLFPPGVNGQIEKVIKPVLFAAAKSAFPSSYDAEGDRFPGIRFPIRQQDDKVKHEGFTRGCLFLNATSRYQPRVVDLAYNDVTDPSRVYDGVWAILKLNTYTYPHSANKGVSLGLNMVMLVADDTKLKSTRADPKAAFAGVQIDSTFDASGAFAQSSKGNAGGVVPETAVSGTGGLW
jgi:hypothetical protein